MSANKSWIVIVECTVKKELVLANCTREKAESDPWDHAVIINEIEMSKWKVVKVELNE
jgi:hypothetical protein